MINNKLERVFMELDHQGEVEINNMEQSLSHEKNLITGPEQFMDNFLAIIHHLKLLGPTLFFEKLEYVEDASLKTRDALTLTGCLIIRTRIEEAYKKYAGRNYPTNEEVLRVIQAEHKIEVAPDAVDKLELRAFSIIRKELGMK